MTDVALDRVVGGSPHFWARVWSFAKRALWVELRIYESLWRCIVRRPAVPSGAMGFGYVRPVRMILIVFIVLSAVEIPILDLIVHRWLPIRIAFLALGIWGLTWMLGLLSAYLTRPHVVGPAGMRVRDGLEIDLPLPWDVIASVRVIEHRSMEKSPRFFDDGEDRVCALRIADATNVEIRFEAATPLRLSGLPPRGGVHECTVLRFWADEPESLLAEVRTQIG